MYKLLFLSCITLASAISHAGQDWFSAKGLGISAGSGTIFLDVNESHDQSECTDKNSFRFKVSNPLYREVYATLLADQVTKKSILIAFSDEASLCLYNAPVIYSVYLKS